jgi:hypothetical protein
MKPRQLISYNASNETAPPRGEPMRLLRFSLRTLFVLVTLASLATCWALYNLNWIEQRRAFFTGKGNTGGFQTGKPPVAPWPLWLFGEQGYKEILVRVENDEAANLVRALWPDEMGDSDRDRYLTDFHRERFTEANELFPEAKVRANFFPTQ